MTDRELLSRAKAASLNAYVPYSRFAVGAALECTLRQFHCHESGGTVGDHPH